MEERVHPIPFRTRKLSSPSPMILHNVMWESRPLSTIAPKPLAALSARGFVFSFLSPSITSPSIPSVYPSFRYYPFILQGVIPQPLMGLSRARQPHSHKTTFPPSMRQRRNFEAHVLEHAALKIPALPFQDEKCVFCKFAQHPHLASAAASLRKATPQPASDPSLPKAGTASDCSRGSL